MLPCAEQRLSDALSAARTRAACSRQAPSKRCSTSGETARPASPCRALAPLAKTRSLTSRLRPSTRASTTRCSPALHTCLLFFLFLFWRKFRSPAWREVWRARLPWFSGVVLTFLCSTLGGIAMLGGDRTTKPSLYTSTRRRIPEHGISTSQLGPPKSSTSRFLIPMRLGGTLSQGDTKIFAGAPP